jgi:NitT/TauT family transport system ATP-binding protein
MNVVPISGEPQSRVSTRDTIIELKQVSKAFNTRGSTVLALDTIDLAVREHEFVALVGPSGCGKSTVLNMLAGLMMPSSGEVNYRGAPVHGANRRVGYMTQKDTLLPWRTVEDNIGIALELRCRATERANSAARLRQIIELVGLKGFEKHYPSEISGGMRKRAALARMLIYEPETLLLDEPFGALDAQLKIIMQQELLRITRIRNMTVVFVTHDLAEAITLADRVVVFSGRPGHIRAERQVNAVEPRDVVGMRFTPQFGALSEDLWNELKDDVSKVAGS